MTRSVKAWAREVADESTLWEAMVIFFISACMMIQKILDFSNGLSEEYDKFFDSFAALSLDDAARRVGGAQQCDNADTTPLVMDNLEIPRESRQAGTLVACLPNSISLERS